MDLSPEAVAILRTLVNNPHHVEDRSALRELLEPRYAMGLAKTHATHQGYRYLEKLDKLSPTAAVVQAKPDLSGPPW